MRFIERRLLLQCRQMIFLLSLVVFLFASVQSHAAMSSIVVEAESGRVLQETQADQRRYPASLTKMMTLYMVFKSLDSGKVSLHQRYKVSRYAAAQAPTKLGLRAGQTVKLQQLILGLVTKSANDAAVVIAEGLARTERAFARQMTLQARQLGMASTVFSNASGLPIRQQFTTARDMARLARALQRNFPEYYRFFSTREFSFRGHSYRNHNQLLTNYPGADGIKTGYIRASGFNLAASATREGKRVVAIVLGGSTSVARDQHMIGLLNSAFTTIFTPPEDTLQTHNLAAPPPSGIEATPPVSLFNTALPSDTKQSSEEWSVQVGAFALREAAENQADQVIHLDSRFSPENQHILEIPHDDGKKVFAVRFANLTGIDAAEVCRFLASLHQDCFLVSPER